MKVHQLEFCFERRGGKRKGAGRKRRSAAPRMKHVKREAMSRHEPLHVTLRIRSGTRSLRCGREFAVVRRAFREARDRNGMRLVHYSVNHDHIHLIIEAENRDSVSRGINGLKVRLARQLNKLWGTSGSLFPDRYHDEVIRTPKQARNVVRYVLHNARKHGTLLPSSIDPCSSAPAFDGWAAPSIAPRPLQSVVPAKTWLLTTGWKRHGLIGLEDVPAAKPSPKRKQR